MEQIIIYIALVLVGLCMGSFAGATVWRLRAIQLKQDKKDGEKIDEKEYKKIQKLTESNILDDRSRCLNCNYVLKWYDLVPLLSWIFLLGRCRKCRKPIGYFEPLIELSVAMFFIFSYILWPYDLNSFFEVTRFIIWLIAGVILSILFAYDAKWFLLPEKLNISIIIVGLIIATMNIVTSGDVVGSIYSVIGSVLILSGLYLLIYYLSKGKWIGFGDIKLGLGLALMLADWRLAYVALFAANLIGCLIVLPGMITGKLKRNSRIPFGPLLIVGFLITWFFGNYFVDIFMQGLA